MAIKENCKMCGDEISIRKMPNGKWVPFDPVTNKPHQCYASNESNSSISVVHMLKNEGILYVDMRLKGGCLWVIGGAELGTKMKRVEQKGYKFRLMPNGGKATQNKPGWYYKDKKVHKQTAQKSDNKDNLALTSAINSKSILPTNNTQPTSYVNHTYAQTILPVVRSAIDNNNNLKIKYYTHYRGAWSVREVTPLRVYLQDNAFYMEAFCHSRQENRIFRLDRIKSAETLARKTINQVAATSSYRSANDPLEQTYKAQSNNYSVEWSNVIAVILFIGLICFLVR